MLGRFEYEDSGILDKTHLRFFTLNTAKRLFTQNGYKIDHVGYSGVASKFKILPTFLAFQFIIVARKTREKRV